MGLTPTESYHILIQQGVPADDALKLVATGKSESGWNPTIPGDGGQSIGLYQIHMPAHWDKLTRLSGSTNRADRIRWLEDPINNTIAAAEVYHSQGLGAWTEYNNKNYEKYLNIVDLNSPVTSHSISSPPGSSWWNGSITEKINQILGKNSGEISTETGAAPPIVETGKMTGVDSGGIIRILFIIIIVVVMIIAGFKMIGLNPVKGVKF